MMPREFFPERPSLPWQQYLGHNGLELGLRKRYIEDLASDGVFSRSVYFGMGSAIIQKRTYAPPEISYVKYTKNLYYLATKNISTFSNIAIINPTAIKTANIYVGDMIGYDVM